MEYLIILLKFIIGLSIINVWLFRTSKSSQWRGGEASNLKAEFEAYGLSKDTMKLVGTVKVALSVLLILSIWFPFFQPYAAYGISILMLGAIAMHFKIKDPIKKSFPAFTFLILSLLTIYL
tara:strand:- start:319 stop:681 length:363 start_codon:yes stop_codon:yes gene_type:complete